MRGARTVTRAAGIDRAVEVAAEEAIVAAVESEAVERALARVLEGPVVEEAVEGALESDAVKRALIEALDSELVDEVWRRLLASEEAQQLVERIAEAPELRAAISAQGVGLIGDIGRTIGRAARRLDDTLERSCGGSSSASAAPSRPTTPARSAARWRSRSTAPSSTSSSPALAAIAALIDSAFSGNGDGVSGLALALGTAAWLALGALYLVAFWCLAGQTPGMRFVRHQARRRRQRAPVRPGAEPPGRARAGGRSPSGSASSGSSSASAAAAGTTSSPTPTWSTRTNRPEPAPWSTGGAGRSAGAASVEPGAGRSGRLAPGTTKAPGLRGLREPAWRNGPRVRTAEPCGPSASL